MRLRKWIDLLGDRSAWFITQDDLDEPLQALLDSNYSPATVNRNASQLGSVF